ncbi:hypothetical protein AAWM_03445 [Aspergillus awamori]|uniref:Uncharacterized protein n=1 Tax=Aspergillus awamori TaxID=105351 RepID=A0A401KMR7_ASPAW|nr:hypothetical protein AAWM_03445 [Aspergillus awamori]GKZ57749.1 hypothetical protein AnigIFM49718_003083 [Aspergillus niger]
MLWEKPGGGEPAQTTWDLKEPLTVKWSHVSGEENKAFCIYLTNRVDYPPVTELVLRYAVMGRDEVTIPPPGPMEIPTNCNYRLWASACGDPETIYAETELFCIDIRHNGDL